MPRHDASELAERLGRRAETVCRHYLSNGRRAGNYWLVGDVANTPGRSMFVRLRGGSRGKGAAGNWIDAATAQYGDLLDLIRESRGLVDFRDVAAEARAFLALPLAEPDEEHQPNRSRSRPGSTEAARRLFAMSRPIIGTLGEAYLRRRGILLPHEPAALRFHPRCYYRPDRHSATETSYALGPAMIAAVTDLDGGVTGAHRTWLDPSGKGKAPIDTPRRAMGKLLGNAVRFGMAFDVMAAGEGIETMLSLRMVLPDMPMVAALSAAHLSAFLFPARLRRLYIARDADPAGDAACDRLIDRAGRTRVEAIALSPRLGDFNADLRAFGADALRQAVLDQLMPGDAERFMELPTAPGTG